ncbi:MAG: carbohydrate ABC transporter permease [Lachnospiraceae bacterium]|jgi:ABC-type glycerol-3-phosphate transport system permease component|nr:carbohydrate ABC transporter permease [Lachnospiraceae bacterium]MCI1726412.1 carbohydrate ABC transporter permease [Lachnospiraceae bacterium]
MSGSNSYTIKKGTKAGLYIHRTIVYIILVLLTILCLFFFVCLIVNSTRAHADISKGFRLVIGNYFLKNLTAVMNNADLPVAHGIVNSLVVAFTSAALAVYFSALTAYAVYAYDFKAKKFVNMFIMMIMMIPTQVMTLGFLNLISKIGMMNNLLALILPSIAAPSTYYFMTCYMQSSLPMEIVEAARIDGCAEFATFNRIVMPILKPALAVQAIFAFVASWNNYFVPSLVISSAEKKTLPILIAQLRSADYLKFDMGQVYMLIVIAVVPVAVVYLCLSKFIIRGVAVGSVKG